MTITRDAQEFENRRLRAVAMLQQKIPQAEIARKLEVTRQSVSRWAKSLVKLGEKGLQKKPRPGRPPKLTSSQRQTLLNLLAKGPGKAGYATQLWTAPRI